MTNVLPMTPPGERIKPRDRDAIVQALRAGVVPRTGLQHVQVGRAGEVAQVIKDVDRIAGGGSAVRLIVGDYGSGKTFFLTLARSIATQRKLVTVHADLSPDRRIHSSGGHARSLYSELMRNMSTRNRPDGGALPSVLEKFIGDTQRAAKAAGRNTGDAIRERLAPLQEMVAGYDFATVVGRYWMASETGDEAGKTAALRWLRAEYTLKTEARTALDVRSIIDDATVYDYIKCMACFAKLAGYDGLLVVMDEMVNLYKLTNSQARNSNYEQILKIVNDVLQGTSDGLGFYFGGTPEFLMDGRRGLYSYEALRSRLLENSFARDGLVDLSGPVIRLQSLTREELFVLLGNLRNLFAGGNPAEHTVPDEAFGSFMAHCEKKVGEAYFRTPRNTIKGFLDLLEVLSQNPGSDWKTLLGSMEILPDAPPSGGDIGDGAGGVPSAAAKPQALPAQVSATAHDAPAVAAPAEGDDDMAAFRI